MTAHTALVIPDVLVGRASQLRLLRTVLDRTALGVPSLLLIDGEEGIGKTSLARHFLATNRIATVLVAAGDAAERQLPFGIVEQLTGDATRSATTSGDPLSVGAALLQAVSASAGGVTAVLVDDAQWADRQSLRAISFAVRRLRRDPVLVLVLTRDAASLPDGLRREVLTLHRLHMALSGLTAAEVGELGARLGVGTLTRAEAWRLHSHTQGNPLFAGALFQELTAAELRRVDGQLPAPRSFAVMVLERLAGCGAGARGLAEAAAVLPRRAPLRLLAEVAAVADPAAALDELVGAGLVRTEQSFGEIGVASFRHPLIGVSIRAALTVARRRELNVRAAGLRSGRAALEHRVAAAVVPDEPLAADLSAAAANHVAGATWSAAAELYLAAVHVSPARADREHRLVRAIDCLFAAGDVAAATRHLTDLGDVDDPAIRDYLHGRLEAVRGHPAAAENLLRRAWTARGSSPSPDLVAAIAGQLAVLCLGAARAGESVRWAERALAADPVTAAAVHTRTCLVMGLVMTGRGADARRSFGAGFPQPTDGSPDGGDALLGHGVLELWTGHPAAAAAELARVVDRASQGGSFVLRMLAAMYLADAEYRCGDWGASVGHAEMAVAAADDGDQAWIAAMVHAIAAVPLAARGDRSAAGEHAAAARAAGGLGNAVSALWAATAAAATAAVAADYGRVVASIEPVLAAYPGIIATVPPDIVPWSPLYIDALLAVGRYAEAGAQLDAIDEPASPFTQLKTARLRGELLAARGDDDAAEAGFTLTLARPGGSEIPLDQARLQQACARLYLRTGRTESAATLVAEARATYRRLGARPFLRSLESDFPMLPGAATERRPRLTPQELAVARLVAAGRSNRDTAHELVLSVKTIEYHLSHVYLKLGIGSRSQLAALLAGNAR